jgi:uncharacterized protein (DUF433 family)
MPVSAVFGNLAAGATADDIADWFELPKESVIEVLKFVTRNLEAPLAVEAVPASPLDARPA